MTPFRPSVPRIPRDEATPGGEVSVVPIDKEFTDIYRNAKRVQEEKMLALFLSANLAITPIIPVVWTHH
jgi:hypothetical protein